MSLIVDEKKRNRWSAVFVSSLLIFSLACFGLMNTRYDALSRYPYTDRRSRELIKQYLTKQEIDYIIEYSIAPNMFVAYIREDGFSIYHAAEYKTLSRYQWDKRPADIVRMIEETRDYIDAETLAQYLYSYPYGVIRDHLVNGDQYAEGSTLIMNAGDLTAWVDRTHTVSRREPEHLVNINGIVPTENHRNIEVSDAIVPSLAGMCKDIEYDLNNGLACGGITVKDGYISYAESEENYKEAQAKYGDKASEYVPYPGHDEHQLGLAVDFCVEGITDADFRRTEQYYWLLWNSWRYGFTADIDETEKDFTGLDPQPWHYRYIGEDLAKSLHNDERSFGSCSNRE
ncbi:MAG: D-alanyl-D-alanine carboxypeptidase family protein [Solobacterium sp.]|nr:D-alanyl-D-alanine carboxypeptidase family protein [Solobacterium sp.]